MAFQVPAPYPQAIRNSGLSIVYTVQATRGGEVVAGDLRPTGGSITDTNKPGVRRALSLELAPTPGLYDALAPIGTTLSVQAVVTYLNRTTTTIPMGVFDIDSITLAEGGGKITVTAPDKWARIQRAKFIVPGTSTPGMLVADQIALMIHDAMGFTEPVVNNSPSGALMGWQVWQSDDRAQAIIDLATSIGCWVYFDRAGVATIDPLPQVKTSADWLLDAAGSGVAVSLDRSKSRTGTHNVVRVTSSASDAETFPPVLVFDNDPNSPTYAGVDPIAQPGTAGPFGISVYNYSTSLPLSEGDAQITAGTILARVTGVASAITATQVPNPAVDSWDAFDVLPPRQRYDIPRTIERHIADTVVHPLTVTGGAQQITGRSTRTDPYT